MKERERMSEKESDMRVENCQLFEAFENVQLKRATGYLPSRWIKGAMPGKSAILRTIDWRT